MTHISPCTEFAQDLLSVENPIRYIGGEFGITRKADCDVDFTFAMAFPDTYEIGMSNSAIKIIYQGLNRLEKVRCERVFCPYPDFVDLLSKKGHALYTLESGIPLCEVDMIGFSIGYELGITNVLTMLESGKVPLLRHERTENNPIIIAGGCGVTNPLPYSDFFDAVFIGEAEEGMFDLINELAAMKKNGSCRSDCLAHFASHRSVWTAEKKETTHRAIYTSFADDIPPEESIAVPCFPISNIRVVQDHGVVEIMRGCPNGCRFCHAGIYYRPQRAKSFERIMHEVDFLTTKAGYREISLTSLSSGDYCGIADLLDMLTYKYTERNVSFQLPSLKVNTFTLAILEKLSQVRKSGLTFAIETPVDAWQMALNKEVFREHICAIIIEAKKRGWNKAKFYFMVGLPLEQTVRSEEEEIVDFLFDIQRRTRIQCSVNVGTFIPKAHTAYQWAAQISPEEAEKKLSYIRKALPRNLFKVSTHREFNSLLEGILSRGDSRVGALILNAYRKGCRLDAWDDHMKTDLWKEVIAEASWDVCGETVRSRSLDESLPWDTISLGLSKAFLKREWARSLSQTLSEKCSEECHEPCGICNNVQKIIHPNTNSNTSVCKNIHTENTSNAECAKNDNTTEVCVKPENSCIESPVITKKTSGENENISVLYRVLFSFTKKDGSEYMSHLSIVETYTKSFIRSQLPILYTSGFNPLPRFELPTSMSLGITSENEIASILLRTEVSPDEFIERMNNSLPSFLHVDHAFIFAVTNKLKRESLASLLWGADYTYELYSTLQNLTESARQDIKNIITENGIQLLLEDTNSYTLRIPFKSDRPVRDALATYFNKPLYECIRISKIQTLAKSLTDEQAVPYFEVYKNIAENNAKLIENNMHKI